MDDWIVGNQTDIDGIKRIFPIRAEGKMQEDRYIVNMPTSDRVVTEIRKPTGLGKMSRSTNTVINAKNGRTYVIEIVAVLRPFPEFDIEKILDAIQNLYVKLCIWIKFELDITPDAQIKLLQRGKPIDDVVLWKGERYHTVKDTSELTPSILKEIGRDDELVIKFTKESSIIIKSEDNTHIVYCAKKMDGERWIELSKLPSYCHYYMNRVVPKAINNNL